MYKGIFWCYLLYFDDDMCYPSLPNVKVRCDLSGKALEAAAFSSKSGDNFNHKAEWKRITAGKRRATKLPFDYYPRGRVEIRGGKIKIFANPVILAEESAKASIIELFELEEHKDKIVWIADNSRHYRFVLDTMTCFCPDDGEEADEEKGP